jgi:formylglycine-generating enzyme required for sulfatase activity
MKFEEATGMEDGTMSIVSRCPNCGSRTALSANPGETVLLKALNAWSEGPTLLAELLEMAERALDCELESIVPPAERGRPAQESSTWAEKAEAYVWIEPGTFVMGSPVSVPGREADEGPQHEVTISLGFFLGKYQVTRGHWTEVMGTTPWSQGSRVSSDLLRPAVHISWHDAQEFVERLNAARGRGLYRLPTEAEWEYACRAGTTTAWSFGDDRSQLPAYACCLDSDGIAAEQDAHEVGMKSPNPWGLHDMHGNVWEWCQDSYSPSYYSESPSVDPQGPEGGTDAARVIRGGYFRYFTRHSRSASRNARRPDARHRSIGVRLLRVD